MTDELTQHEIQGHLETGRLTERQAQILQLRRRGFSQNQVAHGLHISRTTVRYLETRARQKIAIWKETQAA